MFGALRLFLACVVVTYHATFTPFDYNTGVAAVIVFFIISGFVISGLYSARFALSSNATAFFKDRAIRIGPQFYFYLAICLLVFYIFPLTSPNFTPIKLAIKDVFNNIALLPLGIGAYVPSANIFSIDPPAASLATEFLFYLSVPILFASPVITAGAFAVAAIVFCSATWSAIPILEFSYYYLPGTLIFFIIGHLIYWRKWNRLAIALIPLTMNYLALSMTGQIHKGFNKEIYLGLYVGGALIMFLRYLKPNKIDNWMGAVSYGCFLGHYPILVALDHYGVFRESRIEFISLLLFLSILAGTASYFLIELPTLKYRRRISAMNKEVYAFSATQTHAAHGLADSHLP